MIFRRRADLGDNSSGSPSQQEDHPSLSRASTSTLVSEDPQVSTQALPSQEDDLVSAEAPRHPDDPTVSVHPLPSQQGLLIKVEPPTDPDPPLRSHVPCDIVLVIDTSYSMSKLAPAVSSNEDGGVIEENAGFSVLDITKHAALTILESLDQGDRLGIVTFSTRAKVVQELLTMTKRNKELTDENIRSLKEETSTNLWQGIKEGMDMFKDHANSGRAPAVMVLTDGQPNTGHPLGGYVFGIRALKPLPAAIHTFGFGYAIQSGLLKSIAEVGGGSYAFIPDAGMVGTVFVNAVAHLQSTFANKCSLEVTYPEIIGLTTTAGETIEGREQDELISSNASPKLSNDGTRRRVRVIGLGNLQYGQSRDIYLRYSNPLEMKLETEQRKLDVEVRLVYSRLGDEEFDIKTQRNIFRLADMPESEIAYHQSRAMLCDFLASFFPLTADGEHDVTVKKYDMPRSISDVETLAFAQYSKLRFQNLLRDIPARQFVEGHKASAALMEDVEGQINLAVHDEQHFRKWGIHYFLSLWDAHDRQIQNTFKDPGVQMYNVHSRLFAKCKEDLINAFNLRVKAPEPSRIEQAHEKYRAHSDRKHSDRTHSVAVLPMSRYFNRDGPCFAASSMVSMADGRRLPVCSLRKGMAVETPAGSRQVEAVLQTRVWKMVLCEVGELLVTPWHPIVDSATGDWVFPANVADRAIRYSGAVYSVLLQRDGNVDAHGIQVAGVWGVTLGHGLVGGEDARAHRFLGDYGKVLKALAVLGTGPEGVAEGSGVRREKCSGRICGFRKRKQDDEPTWYQKQPFRSVHTAKTGYP